MVDTYSIEVNKLEKLRAAWLPAVEFLFGEAVLEAKFDGFDVSDDIAKPSAVFEHADEPYRYKIQMPARVFSNDVMLLADVIQEMVRGQYPIGFEGAKTPALCEGVAVFGAITAIKQVFGEESVDSYLNALREQAFDRILCGIHPDRFQDFMRLPVEAMLHIVQSGMKCGQGLKCFKVNNAWD